MKTDKAKEQAKRNEEILYWAGRLIDIPDQNYQIAKEIVTAIKEAKKQEYERGFDDCCKQNDLWNDRPNKPKKYENF
jgi:hypothetical protein